MNDATGHDPGDVDRGQFVHFGPFDNGCVLCGLEETADTRMLPRGPTESGDSFARLCADYDAGRGSDIPCPECRAALEAMDGAGRVYNPVTDGLAATVARNLDAAADGLHEARDALTILEAEHMGRSETARAADLAGHSHALGEILDRLETVRPEISRSMPQEYRGDR